MSTLLLHGGVDAAGTPLDLLVDESTGLVLEASRGGGRASQGSSSTPPARSEDCSGMVLLPAPAEPHAHLDKALSAHAAPNPAGDLRGAIDAWLAHRPTLTHEDLVDRARRAAHELVAHGTTAIRSHVDVGPGIGLRAVHAVAEVRDELQAEGLAELQIVALVGTRTLDDPARLPGLLEEALSAGADVVGGCPHLDPDPVASTRAAFAVARAHGLPIDLHTDEQLDPAVLHVRELARLVAGSGFDHGAAASHCVSLGTQPRATQDAVARELADAGVAVVTLPQTNLFLQARGLDTAPPRGLTAIAALRDAGAMVCAGADNVRDPFCSVGRSDALETAALLVMAAHLSPVEAYELVAGAARRAMGLPAVTLAPGSPAEVLALPGADLVDAVAQASEQRLVLHRGRVVARTVLSRTLVPAHDPVLT